MSNTEIQYLPRPMTMLEKGITAIVMFIVTGLLSWVAVNVNSQQVQSAKFSTIQTAQTITLTKIQKSIDEAIPARNRLFIENSLLNQRVDNHDDELNKHDEEINEIRQQLHSLEASR